MKIIYVDESGTFGDGITPSIAASNNRLSTHFVLSALIVDVENWEKILGRFKSLRSDLRHNYGVKKSQQIHAYELIGGRGIWKIIKYKHLSDTKRQKMFRYILENYAMWPEINVISVSANKLSGLPSINPDSAREIAYENLVNRIDKTLVGEDYILINDGQEDTRIIRQLRKMRAFNKVRTSYAGTIDIRTKSLLEDPLFKYARDSYFLQAIDHIAYATLHVFDGRLNQDVARSLVRSKLYKQRGFGVAHRNTAAHFPGVVIVPKLTVQAVEDLHNSLT